MERKDEIVRGLSHYDFIAFDPQYLTLGRVEQLLEDTEQSSRFEFIRLPRLPEKTILAVKRRLDFTAHYTAITDVAELAKAQEVFRKNPMISVKNPFFVKVVLPPEKARLLTQGYLVLTTSEVVAS